MEEVKSYINPDLFEQVVHMLPYATDQTRLHLCKSFKNLFSHLRINHTNGKENHLLNCPYNYRQLNTKIHKQQTCRSPPVRVG